MKNKTSKNTKKEAPKKVKKTAKVVSKLLKAKVAAPVKIKKIIKKPSRSRKPKVARFIYAEEAVHAEFPKKEIYKISTEFAVAVILLVVGSFSVIFWKMSPGRIEIPNESYNAAMMKMAAKEKKNPVVAPVMAYDEWRTLRNETSEWEFKLPISWNIAEEEGRFFSSVSGEEIIITSSNNVENYIAEDLAKIATNEYENSNVQIISGQEGVKIEKREGETIRQVAKLILGEKILTIEYVAENTYDNSFFFGKVIPTFNVPAPVE